MIREVNSTEIDSNFKARETQDSSPLQRHGYKQSSKLSQLQNNQLNLLTVTFLAILKWTAINQRWLFVDGSVKEAKDWRLPLNFQERNLGTASSGKKIRPVGRIVKSWTGHVRVISQANSRISESGPLRCLRKKIKNLICPFIRSREIFVRLQWPVFSREKFTTVAAYRGFVTKSQLLETLFTRT